jgi:RNA polymerase sigma-70 factor (ECF subfamily)
MESRLPFIALTPWGRGTGPETRVARTPELTEQWNCYQIMGWLVQPRRGWTYQSPSGPPFLSCATTEPSLQIKEVPMSPEECMQRIANGEEAALGELYDQLGGLLFSLARRVTGNDREAEEIVQDVFVTAWRNARTFDAHRASVTTWLTTLARNKAIDRLRAARRRLPAAAQDTEFLPETHDPAPTPAENAQSDDRRDRVAAWMSQLPANQRQAVELAFFDGLTHPEIATRLNETIGTVKSRIRLGLDRLRQKMKGGAE